MSCQKTSPPASPRAPKIQQQSWDDCGTPPIDLFDPNNDGPPRSPSRFDSSQQQQQQQPPKSPKSPRKFDKKINIYFEPKSPKSPNHRNFDFSNINEQQQQNQHQQQQQQQCPPPQRSPKAHDEKNSKFANRHVFPMRCGSSGSIPLNSSANGSGSTQNLSGGGGGLQQQYSDPQKSPKYYDRSPKSPRKFDYESISPKHEKGKKFEYIDMKSNDSPTTDPYQSSYSKQTTPKPYFHQKKHSSLETRCGSTGSNNGSISTPPPQILETFSYEKRNSGAAESTISTIDSETTTALISSSSGIGSASISGNDSDGRRGSIVQCDIESYELKESGKRFERRRRHAINITSNPGYNALHSSHSTLDRTCSDGVMSVKCRKSTSDLTDVSESNTPVVATPKRRGSSKGGLAYLASRRSSRESIKSAISNASIFSNEDIGPLAFQSSTRGRQRRTSNFLELPVPDHIRPRVCSLPERPYNPRQSDDLYRLRTFSISKGTVVNCGDSIISRRSRSNTSVNSTTSRASERSPFDGSCCGGGYATVDSLPPSPTDSDPPPPPRYRVVMMGDSGVGKTALVSQFMTSEYMHTYDASLGESKDDEFGEKTVSILLDGEESEMIFIDHPSHEMSVENSLSTYEPHGCVVIYSVVQRSSFRVAEEIVNYLWNENVTRDKAVILVGNKADLARSRVISTTDGKALAASRDAKFIETSSGIQHNVDELLVGILKQIRLKETRDKKAACCSSKMRNSKTHLSLHLAKEILQKICLSDISKSKSCENLHVL